MDEAHTGSQSRSAIYHSVEEACKTVTVQLVMLTASSKVEYFNAEKNTVIVHIWKNISLTKLRLHMYTPRVDLAAYLADIDFYPCLLEKGSYYSVEIDDKTKTCVQIYIQRLR